MKKFLPIAVVVLVLLIIGKIIMSGEANELEKDIVRQVKEGDYYTALEDANEIEFKGEKMSKKISKLVEDIKLYEAAEEELERAEYAEMNLGEIKAILDAMNGSYKKYKQFKSDVKNLKEMVETLEEYGEEGVKLVKKAEKLIEKGKTEEAWELIQEYESDDRYKYMPKSLKDALYELTGSVDVLY